MAAIDSPANETVDLELFSQGGATGQLREGAVTEGGGSLAGSSGSLGSSSDDDDLDTTDDAVAATGQIEFAQRSIEFASDTTPFTVSRVTNDRALEKLIEFGRGASFLAPMDIEAPSDDAAQGVALSFSFGSPITEDEFYSIMFFDEEADAWSPVETTLSPDGTTLTANVDHLSFWTAIRSGGDSVLKTVEVARDATAAGLKSVSDGIANVISKVPEVLYKTGSSIAGNYTDAPECSGDTPDWLLTSSSAIDTPESDYAAPIKFCAGSAPGEPNRLEIKAVVNRTTPFLLDMPSQHVDVGGDLTISNSVGTALDLAFDPVTGLHRTWSNAGSRLLLPGQVATIRIDESAFTAGGNALRLHAEALNPIAGAAFRGLSITLGETLTALGSTVALVVSGKCLVNLTSAAYKSNGDVLGMVGPTASCIFSETERTIKALVTEKVIDDAAAKTLLGRIKLAIITAQIAQTVAEMIMDYATGARTRTVHMFSKGSYENPTTANPAPDLSGPGVTISNSQAVGSEEQFGRSTDMFGGRSSWVLSTGEMSSIENPPGFGASTNLGGPGNPELSHLSGGSTHDAATYRFMVTPTGTKLNIEYTFATEEFPDWVGSGFNDVMAIYVNGVNCAVVPETGQAITVNTVNHETNSHWFADNQAGEVSDSLAFNGLTKDLKCTAAVTPGEQVEVLIAVADTGDHILDSAVALVDGGIYSTN